MPSDMSLIFATPNPLERTDLDIPSRALSPRTSSIVPVTSSDFCMFAISGDELGGETDGSAHCDLLAEDRAHSRLKSIPTAGVRSPGRAVISGASAESRKRWSLIACRSAERSNTRRSRAMIAGSRDSLGNRTRATSAFSFSA